MNKRYTFYTIIALLVSTLIFIGCGPKSTGSQLQKVPDTSTSTSTGCSYQEVKGKFKIQYIKPSTDIISQSLPYEAVEIGYTFIALDGTKHVSFTDKTFTHYLKSDASRILPGTGYVAKYKLEEGMSYPMTAFVIQNGTCVPIKFFSSKLPDDDLSELNAAQNKATETAVETQKAEQAQKLATTNRTIKEGGCTYEYIPGTVAINEVKKIRYDSDSDMGYDEYMIRYQFKPNKAMASDHIFYNLTKKIWSHSLAYYGNAVPVGPGYVAKYGLSSGMTLNASMKTLKEGNCEVFEIVIPDLPRDDFFEIKPSKIKPGEDLNMVGEVHVFSDNNEASFDPTIEAEPKDCLYETVEGYTRVTTVYEERSVDLSTLATNYQPFVVKFVFTPIEDYDKSKINPNQVHQFFIVKSNRKYYPGPGYIRKHDIKVNKSFPSQVQYPVAGGCKRLRFVNSLENDLEELNRDLQR